jgi:hypothetical protein
MMTHITDTILLKWPNSLFRLFKSIRLSSSCKFLINHSSNYPNCQSRHTCEFTSLRNTSLHSTPSSTSRYPFPRNPGVSTRISPSAHLPESSAGPQPSPPDKVLRTLSSSAAKVQLLETPVNRCVLFCVPPFFNFHMSRLRHTLFNHMMKCKYTT